MPGTEPTEMKTYLVESYWPGATERGVTTTARRAGLAAARLADRGHEIHFRGALLVSKDEVALCLFEARSEQTVADACRYARLRFDRILQVLQIGSSIPSATGSRETLLEPAVSKHALPPTNP